mmetsp:Transcript_10523/g.17825  ORF Transcript_10523/g.17825 Transcript_10523/m.17825 type:complete len:440 (+) Transcript_10523:129-1448(+)
MAESIRQSAKGIQEVISYGGLVQIFLGPSFTDHPDVKRFVSIGVKREANTRSLVCEQLLNRTVRAVDEQNVITIKDRLIRVHIYPIRGTPYIATSLDVYADAEDAVNASKLLWTPTGEHFVYMSKEATHTYEAMKAKVVKRFFGPVPCWYGLTAQVGEVFLLETNGGRAIHIEILFGGRAACIWFLSDEDADYTCERVATDGTFKLPMKNGIVLTPAVSRVEISICGGSATCALEQNHSGPHNTDGIVSAEVGALAPTSIELQRAVEMALAVNNKSHPTFAALKPSGSRSYTPGSVQSKGNAAKFRVVMDSQFHPPNVNASGTPHQLSFATPALRSLNGGNSLLKQGLRKSRWGDTPSINLGDSSAAIGGQVSDVEQLKYRLELLRDEGARLEQYIRSLQVEEDLKRRGSNLNSPRSKSPRNSPPPLNHDLMSDADGTK